MNASRDTLLGGALVLWQPARGAGYRFNLDPVLLAGFVQPAGHVLDLGTGCGVLGLLLLKMGKARRVTAVEVQPQLAELAMRNAEENGLSDRFEVICGDCRTVRLPTVDGVACNPPYFPRGQGRPAPQAGREIARREWFGTLAELLGCTFPLLRADGSWSAIVPAQRADELMLLLHRAGATTVRRRWVLPRAGAAAGHVLLAGGGPSIMRQRVLDESPLVVHEGSGRDFSPEVQELLRAPTCVRDAVPQGVGS